MKKMECIILPDEVSKDTVYRLSPAQTDESFYDERTDRNIGWITRKEQGILRDSVVAIAGCGGMGAAVAERFLRMGVGEIRIADGEMFDVSNINRQMAAGKTTIGQNKAFATAKLLRRITDDTTLVVYPQGINSDVASDFISGADVVCDEIEFWELEAAIVLHQAARAAGVSVFGCNTCGFGTHLFLFTPESQTIEGAFELSIEEARELDRQMHTGTISSSAKKALMEMLIRVVTPVIQEYCTGDQGANLEQVRHRLFEEGKASIISTNPALATGFIADHILLYLLRNSGVIRDIVKVPPMPGYLYLDAAKMMAVVCH